MNTLKASSTVYEARREVGRAVSQPNQAEQLRLLNLIRNWAYGNQRELGLNLSVTACAPLETFYRACSAKTDVPEKYTGFRLPTRYQSVEAARYRDTHVEGYSAFQLPYDGVSGFPNDGSVKLFDRGWSPLQRDFTDGCPQALRFAWEFGGADQEMRVVGYTHEGLETHTYTVKKTAQVTSEIFTRVSQISFPSGVKGRVVIAEEGGKELARYSKGETVPQYREYEVRGCEPPQQLVLIANCTYAVLEEDWDVVEFGNPLIWQTLARYMSLFNKDDKTPNDRANMQDYLSQAVNLIRETAAVESGAAMATRFRRKPLTGGRMSRRRYGAGRR